MSSRSPFSWATALLAAAFMASPGVARQQQVFRAGVRGVLVDVAVRDGNRVVVGLGAEDFVVYDNGVRQRVQSVSMGAVPVDVTVFLGTMNQSQESELSRLAADLRAIGALMRRGDRVRLLTLENRVTDAFGWRSADEAAAPSSISLGGVQSIYDAIFLSLLHAPGPDRRHMVIVITDGIDLGSVVDSKTLEHVADRVDAVVHVVVVDPVEPPPAAQNVKTPDPQLGRGTTRSSILPGISEGPREIFLRSTWLHILPDERGVERLEGVARRTGGTVRPVKPGNPVVDSFKRAFDDFRQSYLLRYTATGVEPGGWHELRVELTNAGGRTVRARRGYHGG